MLKIENLKVKVGETEVLKGVDLSLQPGEVVALMGPNGSGKSTLAYVLAGHPNYQVADASAKVEMDGKDILEMTPDERSRQGLFLAFQYPVAIGGVTVRDLLLAAMRSRGGKVSALELKKKIEQEAGELNIEGELLKRDINQGFSGGEKKKMEILQMRLLAPSYAILDETDSGLDIDALKIVADGAWMMAQKAKTGILVITHYQRILKYLKPNRILVMKEGKIVREGGADLVKELEESGYKNV